ncbi:MAG: EAL domain-containing protein [Pseudomonadota bacterium]
MDAQKQPRLIDWRSGLLMVGVLMALILSQAIGGKIPLISQAWLAFAIVGTLIVYLRARVVMKRLQTENQEIQRSAKGKLSRPEFITDSINQTIDRQFEEIRDAAGLSDRDREILDKVETATCEDRLELFLQPIVDLNSKSIRFYEAFSRLRDENGFLLLPTDYLDTVERANRIGFIDNMILLRSVQALRSLKSRSKGVAVFCNVSPATLYDQSFFSLFVQYLDANRDLADQLVFEFTYPAITIVDPTIGKNLQSISERGFSFSVDHLHKFEVNQSALRRLNVKYIKASAGLLANADKGGDAADLYTRFSQQLASAEISLIAEKIETEEARDAAVALGVGFGQGNFFGRPRPVDFYLRNEAPKDVPLKQAS